MKFLLLGLLCFSAFANLEKRFADWMKEYGKTYANDDEVTQRFEIFKDNLAWINKANTEFKHMAVGLNEFADMTQDEFESYYLMDIDSEARNAIPSTPQDPDNIPINGKCMTSVINQGKCGSCWACAASCSMEGLLCIKSKKEDETYAHVAPQLYVDCVDSGCGGGFGSHAMQYGLKNGVCAESEYPYKAVKGRCHSCANPIKTMKGLNSCKDKDGGITKAVAGNLIDVAIDAGGLAFRFYKNGTYGEGLNCNKHSLNHEVTVTDMASKFDVSLSPNGNYHVKNSWGTSWGKGGYFDMPAGVNCLGIDQDKSYYPY